MSAILVLNGDRFLVVDQRIRRRPPITRSVALGQPNNVGKVRSHVGSTTRNRDQPSQAQNINVPRRSTVGPAPQSNCSHNPGSATSG